MADEWDFSQVVRLENQLGKNADAVEEQSETILTKTGTDVVADAKILAPYEFGNLQDSIGMSGTGLEREVGPTAEYGIWQELGTSVMAPQPFMGPALERNTPGMIAAFEQLVDGSARG